MTEFNLSEKDCWCSKCNAIYLFPLELNICSKCRLKEFIRLLKEKATKRIRLNFDREPCKEGEDFAYCGGCNRFVIEEGCICEMIDIIEIDKLAEELKSKLNGENKK